MRLALVGRLLYGALALANLWIVAGSIARAEWLACGLALILAAIFGIPAITGRDRFAYANHAPSWLAKRETPLGRDKSAPTP